MLDYCHLALNQLDLLLFRCRIWIKLQTVCRAVHAGAAQSSLLHHRAWLLVSDVCAEMSKVQTCRIILWLAFSMLTLAVVFILFDINWGVKAGAPVASAAAVSINTEAQGLQLPLKIKCSSVSVSPPLVISLPAPGEIQPVLWSINNPLVGVVEQSHRWAERFGATNRWCSGRWRSRLAQQQ